MLKTRTFSTEKTLAAKMFHGMTLLSPLFLDPYIVPIILLLSIIAQWIYWRVAFLVFWTICLVFFKEELLCLCIKNIVRL